MILLTPHFSALNYFCGYFATDVVDWPKIPLWKNKVKRPLEESSYQSLIITQDKRLKNSILHSFRTDHAKTISE